MKISKVLMSMTVMVFVLTVPTPADAYLDPSTGSMILSAIVALLATLGLALKTYWYRLRAFFRRAEQQPQGETAPHGGPVDGDGTARRRGRSPSSDTSD
jgi:hypothetical protein